MSGLSFAPSVSYTLASLLNKIEQFVFNITGFGLINDAIIDVLIRNQIQEKTLNNRVVPDLAKCHVSVKSGAQVVPVPVY